MSQVPPPPAKHGWLGRALGLTVASLYSVILAGSVVRASGSGMGCPDWPRCFGRLIPPTSVDQIPPEFMERFLTEGHGNLFHTWVEFLNRVLGGLSGLCVLATLLLALFLALKHGAQRGRFLRVAGSLLAGFVLFIVVAWLGKVVVDTTLAPAKITLHMVAGLILMATAIYARVSHSTPQKIAIPTKARAWLWVALGITLAQILVGTQVRELVDHLPEGAAADGRLEASLAPWFSWHWAGAITATLATVLFTKTAKQSGISAKLGLWVWLPMALIIAEYVLGVLLIRLHLPPMLQPAHFVLSTVLLGTWLVLLWGTRREKLDAKLDA